MIKLDIQRASKFDVKEKRGQKKAGLPSDPYAYGIWVRGQAGLVYVYVESKYVLI